MSVAELRAEGLTIRAGDTTLVRDLDFRAPMGEVTGITGPSGSGKTSLLYALGGLIPPSAGLILVDGEELAGHRELSTGLILQNLCLVPLLTAQETVALPLQAKGLPKAGIAARSKAALESLGLGEHLPQLVSDLSGGQRQRVAVARAFAEAPDIILADEPTSALDPHWRGVVLELMQREAGRGAVVIVASSDVVVTAACHEIVTLG
jgi:putative ABC transport system ATP-binding protein